MFAICVHCRAKISRDKGTKHMTISGMLNHLCRYHPFATGTAPARSIVPVPPTAEAGHPATWGAKGPVANASKLTQTTGEMLALDGQPFTFAERPGFRRLLALLAPSYQMPPCTTFSRTVVPSLYEACREHLREELHKAGLQVALHFTSDIWSIW